MASLKHIPGPHRCRRSTLIVAPEYGAIGTRRYRPTVAAVCRKLSGAGTRRHYIDATGTRRQRFTLPLQACV
jgi:hypothetical protein